MSAPTADRPAPAIENAQLRETRADEMAVLGAMMLAAPASTRGPVTGARVPSEP